MLSISLWAMLQYGEDVDVADWFNGFCIVHKAPQAAAEKGNAPGPSPPKKARRPKARGSRKVLQVN